MSVAVAAVSALQAVAQHESLRLLPTYERQPVLFERGEGVYLYDSEGRRYLDFLSGIGVNALGHAHPAVVRTIQAQAARLVHVSNLFYHPFQASLAQLLAEISGLDRVFFCNSGTEAWEGALKLARAHALAAGNAGKGKTCFLVMENSFHGRTAGSLSTTGQKKYREPFEPLLPGVTFVPFNDVAALRQALDGSVCAIGMETIQGEGGVQPASPEFLAEARRLCSESGALLILDEIQCGLGRTGKYFAYQHYGVQPDIVTVAKPLAAGLPLGAILCIEAVSRAFHPGMHGTTFGGGPLACAVGETFITRIKTGGMLEHVAGLGRYFLGALRALQARHASIREVRGLGLMVAAELHSADVAKAAVSQMLERGIIINRTHETVLRFLPPYIAERQHVDEVVSALDAILQASASAAAPQTRKTT